MAIGFTAGQIEYILAGMNAQTTAAIANPQMKYREKYFDTSGDFQRPVISLHKEGDGFVGVYNESVLRDTVTAAGKENMFAQAYTSGSWHCAFTPAHS